MISKSKSILSAMALIAAIGAASPALAQGYPTTTAPGTYGWHSYRANRAARSGLDAYARVPGYGYGSNIAPYATGGGSYGSNWAAEHDY